MSSSRLNIAFSRMKNICYNPANEQYKNYGAKGITVCEEWKDDTRVGKHKNLTKGWVNFQKWALENGYEEGLALHRIDSNKNFNPQNCIWEKPISNTNQIILTYKGKAQTLIEWCKELNLDYKLISSRINKHHWSVERAFETEKYPLASRIRQQRLIEYNGKTQNVTEWSKELGIGIATIVNRLNLLHWSVEKTLETKLNPKHHMITCNNKTQCLKDWCREIGLDYHKVYNRIYNLNWSVDEALEMVEKKYERN